MTYRVSRPQTKLADQTRERFLDKGFTLVRWSQEEIRQAQWTENKHRGHRGTQGRICRISKILEWVRLKPLTAKVAKKSRGWREEKTWNPRLGAGFSLDARFRLRKSFSTDSAPPNLE